MEAQAAREASSEGDAREALAAAEKAAAELRAAAEAELASARYLPRFPYCHHNAWLPNMCVYQYMILRGGGIC